VTFGNNRIVPTLEIPDELEAESPLDLDLEETILSERGNGVDKSNWYPHNWRAGRGKMAGCDTDEIEEMMVFLEDEDTVEGQKESQAKLDDVRAQLALEEEVVQDMDAIDQAVTDEKEALADKLDAAIAGGNVALQSEVFEGVRVDLANLRDAHSNEMAELQNQLANNAAANDELLAMRLKRRRAVREKALREAGANEKQVKVVMKEFDALEKATLEHQQASQDAIRNKTNAVAAVPAECLTDNTAIQSEAELRKQFNTDKSTLEALKSNEKGRLEESLQKKLLLRQKKRRAELERKALEEKEARLQREIQKEKQNYDLEGKAKPKLVRMDSMRQMQTLEDMVIQHEEEVGKLESMIGSQNARQANRLEERLKRRKEARLRQLKQAKVNKKDIKRDLKKQKKLDEVARAEIEAESVLVNQEVTQTSQMLAETPEVATAQEFKQLLEEARTQGQLLENQQETETNNRERKLQARLQKRQKGAGGKDVVEDEGGTPGDSTRTSSTRSVDWELDALERAKQQASEFEKKKQEALMATKKEHQKDISFLESQLKEEMDLKESQLRARLEKRQAKAKKRVKPVAGPPAVLGYGQKLVLEPLTPEKRLQNSSSTASIQNAEVEFEQEISKLKADFAVKREKVLAEQDVRLTEEARLAKANVENEAAAAVEKAKVQQLEAATALDAIREDHKKETASLQQDMDVQQQRMDERLQARLAKRKKTQALKQSQPDQVRVESGPVQNGWTTDGEKETDPEILQMQAELAERKEKFHAIKREQQEKEREQRRAVQAAHAGALAAASAYNTFKDKLFKDERRALVRQSSKNVGMPKVDENGPNTPAANLPGELTSEDSVKHLQVKPKPVSRSDSTASLQAQQRGMAPTSARGVLRLLIKLENHKFTEDECLVLEEFSRMVRKNVKA